MTKEELEKWATVRKQGKAKFVKRYRIIYTLLTTILIAIFTLLMLLLSNLFDFGISGTNIFLAGMGLIVIYSIFAMIIPAKVWERKEKEFSRKFEK